jgi:ribonuclease VapC
MADVAEAIVFDASTILALLRREPGWEKASAALPGAVLCSVNLAEVCSKVADWGLPAADQAKLLHLLTPKTVPFDTDLALRSGVLRPATKAIGLSLGDRACLALGLAKGLPVLTADTAWSKLALGIEVRLLR